MTDLSELVEMETNDLEMIPEIVPLDARLSVKGSVEKMVELFERAANITPVKEILSGTSHALLETFEESSKGSAYARVYSTDGEISLATVVDHFIVSKEGKALVPPRKILSILKLAPASTIAIIVVGNTITLRSGRAVWTVATIAGDELASVPDLREISLQSVPRLPLLSALIVTKKAVSTNTARPALVQAKIHNGEITSCDGSRIHRQRVDGLPKTISTTILSTTMDELIKGLSKSDAETVGIGVSNNFLTFSYGSDYLISSRMQTAFPSVEALILAPAMDNEDTLVVDRDELAAVVKRVRVNADPEHTAVFLKVVPGKKLDSGETSWSLAVRAFDSHGNSSQEVMEAQWSGEGKAREICLNHRHLNDLLVSCPEATVPLKLGTDTKTKRSPVFVEFPELNGFTAVLQQIRVE